MNLDNEQKKALEKIWWVYGNHGKKSTLLNHKLIQGFLQYNEDRRSSCIEGNRNIRNRLGEKHVTTHGLTDECLQVVNLILKKEIKKALDIALDKNK